jgi:transcriptional regulator with PAS, ATPase and Fis domain
VGLGPIAQAVEARSYDEVVFLSDYPEGEVSPYLVWLKARTSTKISVHYQQLSSPTHFGEIHEAAVKVVSNALKRHSEEVALTFHLSPGTPAMAAVWIILAKTRFPAELIESSKEHGVRIASVPFDISAEFLPDLLRKPDRDLERLCAGLPPEAPEFVDIIHRSAIMKRVISQARLVAPRSVSVLIEGESGTGKELLARAIHRASPRRDKPFVAVNCGAIPSELVEAELFGYVKGAFSGATRSHAGYFEKASTGTLFLDEIGELSLAAQVKILRVLQEKEVTRLGSTSPVSIDVRLLAATNLKLIEEVANGRFRTDLFYRLAVAVLQLPPLRERPGDLGLLIDRLLDQINAESAHEPGFSHKKLSASAKNTLLKHHWPGNVRELFNTLLRSAIWSSGATIRSNDIASAMLPIAAVQSSEILNKHLGEGLNLPEIISTVARHYLSRAMEESHGNKTKATELLGLPSYQTLTNWLKKYGLE